MEHAHPHNHDHHGHDHVHITPASHSIFFFAIVLNTLFMLLQLVYAYLAHSNSLLADAGHNFSDVLALAFSWLTLHLSRKKSTSTHSYGYKKSTILSTLANAILLVVASTLIIFDACLHLIHPASVTPIPVIVVALIGILINGGSALLFLKSSKNDLNIKSTFLHLLYDAAISFSVVVGGVLIYFTHWNRVDPLLGLVITILILKNSLHLLKKTIDLSLDGVPKEIDLTIVSQYLGTLSGVTAIHDLHIWAMSTTENALTVHLIRQAGNFNAEERQKMSHDLRDRFKITHTTIQIEEHIAEDCLHEQNC